MRIICPLGTPKNAHWWDIMYLETDNIDVKCFQLDESGACSGSGAVPVPPVLLFHSSSNNNPTV